MMGVAEDADRYTILCLKAKHGLSVSEDLDALRHTLLQSVEYRLDTLRTVNGLLWDVEELITKESDLATIGALYLALRGLNAKRVAIKNEIAAQHGEPIEQKTY